MGPDVAKCREPVKANLALYIGGMGARNKNFYNDYARRARLRGSGGKNPGPVSLRQAHEAVAAVPDKMVDEVALVGPRERIAERVAAWKASPIKTMLIGTRQVERACCDAGASCSS